MSEPALAGGGGVSDELASTLLPVLIHRMNNATQLMSNLSALSRCGPGPGGADWLEERAEDLAEASRSVDELGYLLAVLASSLGADLLLERRAPRGLAWMSAAVGDCLKREGRTLAASPRPQPDQAAGVAHGWELAWALGALLLTAGRAQAPELPLEWQWLEEPGAWVLVCACSAPRAVDALRGRLAQRLPESNLDVRNEGWSWRLPARWLAAPSGA